MGRRAAGAGSSPVLPTKSQRTKLWKRLRRLDRELYFYDTFLKKMTGYRIYRADLWVEGIKLDQKRKEIRNKLKGY